MSYLRQPAPSLRIVYITGMLPARMNNGTEIATNMIANMLREQGHSVLMAGFARPDDVLPGTETIVLDRRPIEFADASRAQKAAWAAEAVLRNEPLSVSKYRHPANTAKFQVALRKGVDCVIVDKPQMAVVLRKQIGRLPVSVVWHAIEHQTYGAVADDLAGFKQRVYHREAKLALRMERAVARRVNHVFTLTYADATAVRNLGFAGQIDVCPMTVPTTTSTQRAAIGDFKYDIGLLGNWSWSANASGLEWFLREVSPKLDPRVSIAIGGKGAEAVMPGNTSVKRLGFVEDARVFLGECRAVAIPLTAGTGISMKVLEGACAGWPVVTTTIGARGIGDLPASVTVADDPKEFAQALQRIGQTTDWQRRMWAQAGDTWMQNRQFNFADSISMGLDQLRKSCWSAS